MPTPADTLIRFSSVAGLLLVGWLLARFNAHPALLGVVLLLGLYLVRAGTDALVLANVVVTVWFLLLVRVRHWPEGWTATAPAEHPQLWASVLFSMWFACVLSSIALAQAAQRQRLSGAPYPQRLLRTLAPASLGTLLGYGLGLH